MPYERHKENTMTQWVTITLSVLLAASVASNIWQASSDQNATASTSGTSVVAKVGNKTLTEHEMRTLGRDIIKQEKTLFRTKERVVDSWVSQQVMELEAASQKKTMEELFKEVQSSQTVSVGDQEVKDMVQQVGKVYPDPKDPNKRTLVPEGDARRFLEQKKRQESMTAYFETLKKKYPVTVYLQEPEGIKITQNIALTDRPSFGNPNSKVKLVEFSDFQCPYCARFAKDTVARIKQEFGDKIFFVFRDLPIASHKHAFGAAVAAKCANKSGKFWEYHDLLFDNQQALEQESLVQYASELGIDSTEFKSCLSDNSIHDLVREDLRVAQELNINGTPSLVFNGELIEGAVSFDAMKKKIDEALR
jgi:protein-disulfide isomerase